MLPIGYADGYAWRLTAKAEALVRGRRVPVVGAVSMDMIFVDLTDVEGRRRARRDRRGGGAARGARASERITASELAERGGTIPYELLCLARPAPSRAATSAAPHASQVRSRFEGGLP